MTSPHHYKSNLRDIYFNLFEVLRIQDGTLGVAPFGSLDEETTRDALQAYEVLASNELAASFVDSDRVPLQLDADGNVTLPAALKKSIQAFYANDWHTMELPEHLGGVGAPPSVNWAMFEMSSGANPAAAYYFFGTTIAKVIDRLGTPAQKKRFVQATIDRHWGGTMVLTEPDAGSDVGAARARARHIEGDVWELEGTKRFITNGDFDGTENIVHLILARPEGAGQGTKGLSMFIVPKFWVNDDGSLGERNGVYVSAIEHKLGIKGSATCEMVLGDRAPCRGFLVGEKHDGIRQMFHVIEHARMAVGVKSMSTLSTAYLNARQYATERIQGADLAQAADKNAPRVPIIRHPDVRRMLMAQKATAEGLRALALYTASIQDQVELAGGHAAAEAKPFDKLNDLLLPLVKGYSSEKGFEMLSLSLQCYGGAGYCQDYPAEQYLRDQRIDALYEGTTHIQSLDLLFRKVMRDGGQTLQGLLAKVQETAMAGGEDDPLAAERKALLRALGDLGGLLEALLAKMQESIYHVGMQGNRALFALSEVVIGWLLVRHADVALAATADASTADRIYYAGKVASARWWCADVLPGLTLARKQVENSSIALMDLDDEAF